MADQGDVLSSGKGRDCHFIRHSHDYYTNGQETIIVKLFTVNLIDKDTFYGDLRMWQN